MFIRDRLLTVQYNPQFFHTQVRCKSSVLSKNVATSFFNYLLHAFVCLSLYLTFFQKIILSIILCNHQFYETCYMKIFSFIRKCFHFIFNYLLNVFICLLFYLSFFQKIFNIINYPM